MAAPAQPYRGVFSVASTAFDAAGALDLDGRRRALACKALMKAGGVIAHETARLPIQPPHPETGSARSSSPAGTTRWGR